MNWDKAIFLAHASEDKAKIIELYRELKMQSLEPWLDEESLDPGVKWEDKIKEAISKARFFVACISKNSVNKSGFVQKELRMALNELESKPPENIYFIPALLEKVDLPNISVGTINLTDYQAVKLYDDEKKIKFYEFLRKQTKTEEKKSSQVDINKVLELIRRARIKEALELLLEIVNQNIKLQVYKNNIILLMSKFEQFRKADYSGILSFEEKQIQSNRIVVALLEIVDSIRYEEN